MTKEFKTAIQVFATVLVVACPCSLGLATPLAIVVANGICMKKGIIVKSSGSLENAGKIKNVMFDKTGTLTNGTLKVSKVINYSNEPEETILKYVASLEKKSEHPISKAIVGYAKENGAMIVAIKDFKTIVGQGIFGKIGNDEIYIGNQRLLEELQISTGNDNDSEALTSTGNSICYVVKNREVVALIGIKDIIRENSKELVESLESQNIVPIMLTGDNENTAKVIAKELGIKEVVSNCSPKEKAEKVEEYKKNGITAMCGDGINDSIGLIKADIGIAISNGTDVSIDSADVIMMNDNLFKILDLIKISKSTIRVIKQNLFWAFLYNVCMIPIACGIFRGIGVEINPMIGSFAMMLSSLIVVLNSLRLKAIY